MSRPEAIFSAVCCLTNTFIKRCVSRKPVVFIKREATALSLTAKIVRYLNVKPSIAGLQVKRTCISSEGLPLLMGVNTGSKREKSMCVRLS